MEISEELFKTRRKTIAAFNDMEMSGPVFSVNKSNNQVNEGNNILKIYK